MTDAECEALRPGDVIRSRKTGALRVVCATGFSKRAGRVVHVFLVKIGRSWTDPNPAAGYDRWTITREFDTTGRPRMLKFLRTVPLFFVTKTGRVSSSSVKHE